MCVYIHVHVHVCSDRSLVRKFTRSGLSLQVGDAKEPVRKGVRGLFREMCSFCSSTKLFAFVLEGLKSKNARQRTG